MKFSIVIAAMGNPKLTADCIASIRAHSSDYEIILVDNGSDQATRDSYKDLAGPDLILDSTVAALGVNRSYNIGLLLAKGDYIACMNNDTIACPGWLTIFQNACDKYNAIAGAAGENVKILDGVAIHTDWVDWKAKGLPLRRDYVGGGAWCIPRHIFNAVGLLDENLGNWYSDTDYGARAARLGYSSIVVELPGYQHFVSVTMRQVGKIDEVRYLDSIRQASKVFVHKQSLYDVNLSHIGEVTVGILSWNTLKDTKLCVESVLREREWLRITGVRVKIVVVDNGSEDGTREWLATVPGIDVVANATNTGNCIGRNQIIDRRSGKYLFFLDSDIAVVAGSFVAMLQYIEEHPEIANLGAFWCNYTRDYKKRTEFLSKITRSAEGFQTISRIEGSICAMTQYGVFRSEVFDTCRFPIDGAWAEPGWGFEDNDFALQMKANGHAIYRFEDITYYHSEGSAMRIFKSRGQDGNLAARLAQYKAKWGLEEFNVSTTRKPT